LQILTRSTTFLPLCVAVLALALATACSDDNPSSPSGSSRLTAPAIDAPAEDEQLDTVRPTLVVRNGTSDRTGNKTYEFQVADNNSFSAPIVSRAGVTEDASGKTRLSLTQDLTPATRFFWRARLVQGSTNSDWSPAGAFRTKLVGFNRPGELYDPLVHGETVGTPVGAFTFVPGKGLRIDSETSFVRYELPQTVSEGEFSVEVEGLRPDGPGQKLKIFSMMDGFGDLISSKYQLSVQYRGRNGNPDNCISFKAVWGDDDVKLEPDFAQRAAAAMALNPAQTYLWQASWTRTSFRLVLRDGGINGAVLYDRTMTAPDGTGPYAPVPHVAYLGANSAIFNTETGSWPGVTYRNVWLGTRPRPASLGSALRRQ
jgi:hypothetical protein